ncbi:hypothetical protein JCM30237_02030 [Halolamina litorea]|uniref:DUF7552 domain-containing protein n=1 Tax=Halolamina litorea TaxID=1515593 RepID=A0ABD6BSV5_9EURY|nr:hypothetical protein [Halolamina litorea]
MTDGKLCPLRERIEALASERGEYYLVCGRYGDRPVPAAGCRFENRSTACEAARLTEEYRAVLRGYDPELPRYDIVVRRTPEFGTVGSRSGGDGSTAEAER